MLWGMGIRHVHVVLPNARFPLPLNVLFMSFDKLLSDLLMIHQVPIFLKLFNSFFLNNSSEDVFACRLVVDESLLLDEMFNSVGGRLVDAIPVPQLLVGLLGLLWAFEASHGASFLSEVVNDYLGDLMRIHVSEYLGLSHVEARLITLERQHFALDLPTLKSLLTFHLVVKVVLLR